MLIISYKIDCKLEANTRAAPPPLVRLFAAQPQSRVSNVDIVGIDKERFDRFFVALVQSGNELVHFSRWSASDRLSGFFPDCNVTVLAHPIQKLVRSFIAYVRMLEWFFVHRWLPASPETILEIPPMESNHRLSNRLSVLTG